MVLTCLNKLPFWVIPPSQLSFFEPFLVAVSWNSAWNQEICWIRLLDLEILQHFFFVNVHKEDSVTGSSASRVHFDPQRSGRRTAAASCEYGLKQVKLMSLAMAVAQSISFRALKNNQICWSTGTCIPSLSSSLARCSGEFKQIVTTSAIFSHCSQTYSSTLNTS